MLINGKMDIENRRKELPKECKTYFHIYPGHSNVIYKYKMVFVDNDMFDIMSGSDWEK